MSTPRLTVLMPVYNAEAFLRVAIESILNQTNPIFEFLIIDDGSTDCSVKIIREYEDPRIRLIENEENCGLVATLNRGLSLARGEYIARMDADDLSLPTRFEKQLSYLDTHPEVGILGSGIQILNSDGEYGDVIRFPEDNELISWYLYFYCPIAHPSVMLRRNVLDQLNGYRTKTSDGYSLDTIEDYDLWFRALKVTELHNLQEPLTRLRKHESNITRTNLERHVDNSNQLARKMINDIWDQELSLAETLRLRAIRDKSLKIGKSDVSLYHRLLEEFLRQQQVSPSDERLVRYDASSMLLVSWRQTETLHETLQLLWTGFRISPSAALDFCKEMFPKLIKGRNY